MKHAAVDILVSAADAITNRADQRDCETGERSMARAVATFNALTKHSLSERDGWVFMVILKLSRAQEGRHVIDDYLDGAAYVALAGESIDDSEDKKNGG
jgi:hypothetical protein